MCKFIKVLQVVLVVAVNMSIFAQTLVFNETAAGNHGSRTFYGPAEIEIYIFGAGGGGQGGHAHTFSSTKGRGGGGGSGAAVYMRLAVANTITFEDIQVGAGGAGGSCFLQSFGSWQSGSTGNSGGASSIRIGNTNIVAGGGTGGGGSGQNLNGGNGGTLSAPVISGVAVIEYKAIHGNWGENGINNSSYGGYGGSAVSINDNSAGSGGCGDYDCNMWVGIGDSGDNGKIVIIITNHTVLPNAIPLLANAVAPIDVQHFTGSAIIPLVKIRDGLVYLERDVDYVVVYSNNVNIGTATAIITGIGNYTGMITVDFEIVLTGINLINIDWGEKREFVFNGQPQSPTAIVNGFSIRIEGEQINAGSHTAVAELAGNYPNVMLRNPFMPYLITPKPLTVDWNENAVFVFDRTVQYPRATVSDGGVDIPLSSYLDVNNFGINAGRHFVVAEIIDQNVARNYTLSNRRHGFEIEKRPISVAIGTTTGVNLLPSNTARDTIIVTPSFFDNRVDLENLIATLVDLTNFSRDPNTNQYDDISVFGDARPTVRIIDPEAEIEASSRFGRSDDLVRYRLYLLRIETEGMLAVNYQIGATEFFIRTEEFRPSFIRQNTSRDNRYGIILENAVVSDFARISVITPEQATVNLAIFDNLGNVVFSTVETRHALSNNTEFTWNLTNQSDRFVANGTYMIIVEAVGISGRRYLYSARVGVNR
ncbi:MAG: hypothetical protein FWE23_08430 [Chitinivibrionia bacterium]|nr:hypothetical protein [Chitinivibrionia bacterium]